MKLKKRSAKGSKVADSFATTSAPTPQKSYNVDLDTLSDVLSEDAYISLLGAGRKTVQKPDISRLPDAVTAGIPNFDVGDSIVIERYATFLKGCPYLDTRTYEVLNVDTFSGRLHLYDNSASQFALSNFKRDVRRGNIYKLASGNVVATKKKRGRPRKTTIETASTSVVVVDPAAPKRRRGRPAGVKNRDRDIVKAEKEERKAAKKAKKAKKASRLIK